MEYRLTSFIREGQQGESLIKIAELSDGFDPVLEAPREGMIPVSFYTPGCVPEGVYKIHVVLRAVRDTGPVFLFTGRKQLQNILYLKQGQRIEGIYYQSVAEFIPRYHENICMVEHLFFTYCAPCREDIEVEVCRAESTERVKRIFLCGDSTVTDQCAEIPYHPGACYASWGQALPFWLGLAGGAVENQAHSGNTTESFRRDGHYSIVKHHLKEGDFCLFQFGHNDQKLPHLQADREYPENLRKFIKEVRESGAIPVLVTPLGRNTWDRNGTYCDLLKEHGEAVIRVANETDTRVIGLHDFSVNCYREKGEVLSRGYFHPGDCTHTNEYGACLSASFIAEKLAELFPEHFTVRKAGTEFIPPEDLWERLERNDNRKQGQGEAELFDRMEKSVKELFRATKQAQEESKRLTRKDTDQ